LFTSDYTQNRRTHKPKPVPIQKELKNEKDFVQHLDAEMQYKSDASHGIYLYFINFRKAFDKDS